MYAYKSDIDRINKRLERIEHAIETSSRLDKATEDLINIRYENCNAGKHEWERIKYDLLQGKWGTDQCVYCHAKHHWSYSGGKFSESISFENM